MQNGAETVSFLFLDLSTLFVLLSVLSTLDLLTFASMVSRTIESDPCSTNPSSCNLISVYTYFEAFNQVLPIYYSEKLQSISKSDEYQFPFSKSLVDGKSFVGWHFNLSQDLS